MDGSETHAGRRIVERGGRHYLFTLSAVGRPGVPSSGLLLLGGGTSLRGQLERSGTPQPIPTWEQKSSLSQRKTPPGVIIVGVSFPERTQRWTDAGEIPNSAHKARVVSSGMPLLCHNGAGDATLSGHQVNGRRRLLAPVDPQMENASTISSFPNLEVVPRPSLAPSDRP